MQKSISREEREGAKFAAAAIIVIPAQAGISGGYAGLSGLALCGFRPGSPG
jgi:hypothetical protein